MLVLDSGGLARLAARTKTSVSLIRVLTAQELWPPLVPTMVLVESLHGDAGRDANTNRFLKTCIIESTVSVDLARRTAELRRLARSDRVVDALVVAIAEPHIRRTVGGVWPGLMRTRVPNGPDHSG